MKRMARLLLAATVVITGALVMPGAAHAAEACTPNVRTFDIPNGEADITVTIHMCIWRDNANANRRGGFAKIWWDTNPGYDDKRFDAFIVQVRTERYDSQLDVVTCDLLPEINNEEDGYSLCTTAARTSTAKGGWTGDGKVTYNIDGDGKDNFVWELGGSPMIN